MCNAEGEAAEEASVRGGKELDASEVVKHNGTTQAQPRAKGQQRWRTDLPRQESADTL
jgi:hypothetical protein